MKRFQFSKNALMIALLSLTALISGCTTTESVKKDDSKLQIVATFYPMAEFSRQVAGDLAQVVTLIPTGVEPHDWEPGPNHMVQIQEADLFVYNGIGMEGFVEQTLDSLTSKGLLAVEASKGVTLIEGSHDDHAHEDAHAGETAEEHAAHADEENKEVGVGGKPLDPHVWLSPLTAQQQVRNIQNALSERDPANAAQYEKNANAYIEKLKALDEKFKQATSNAKHKEFVTQHAAFGYMAEQYGLEQVGISGLSPEQEPSAGKVAEVTAFVKEHGINYILFEALVSPKVAETVAKEAGVKTAV